MKKYIIIVADTNDADYVTSKKEITNEEIEKLKPVINAIKNSKQRHNWETSEYGRNLTPKKLYEDILTEEQIDMFDDYCPYGEYGIHTIISISILEVINEYKLL